MLVEEAGHPCFSHRPFRPPTLGAPGGYLVVENELNWLSARASPGPVERARRREARVNSAPYSVRARWANLVARGGHGPRLFECTRRTRQRFTETHRHGDPERRQFASETLDSPLSCFADSSISVQPRFSYNQRKTTTTKTNYIARLRVVKSAQDAKS